MIAIITSITAAVQAVRSLIGIGQEVADIFDPETEITAPNYFAPHETACRCANECGAQVKPELLDVANLARHLSGVPWHLNRGGKLRGA